MGLISEIKNDIAKSGQNKAKILFVREKTRVRFLTELDEGHSFIFHDNFNAGINCLCPKELDEDNSCTYCETETDVRTRKLYAWSVYNYDTKEVQIALFAVNQCTPVSQLLQMSENYGTIMDRDYVLIKTGKQQSTTYTVIPQDKEKFRNEKALPMSKEAMVKILSKAFTYEAAENSDDDEVPFDVDESPKKAKKQYAAADDEMPIAGKKKKVEVEDEEDEGLTIEFIEDKLDNYDIDADEFCEYCEVKSLKKLTTKTEKEFKKLVKSYLASLEDDEDDEDEE